MKWNCLPVRLLIVLFSIFFISQAVAYDEPPINLGYTSFLDGMPPSGPGLYVQDYLQYYTADRFNDNNGNTLLLPDTNLDATVNILQLIYLSKIKIGNA